MAKPNTYTKSFASLSGTDAVVSVYNPESKLTESIIMSSRKITQGSDLRDQLTFSSADGSICSIALEDAERTPGIKQTEEGTYLIQVSPFKDATVSDFNSAKPATFGK